MNDSRRAELRISDVERESAMSALGEHMSSGRLDVNEYGERSAKVSAAKTRGELLELFGDLPEPHPRFTDPTPSRPAAVPAPAPGNAIDRRSAAQKAMAALVPLAGLIAVALFFVGPHTWLVFLIPAAVAVIGGGIWGDDWRHDRRGGRARRRW